MAELYQVQTDPETVAAMKRMTQDKNDPASLVASREAIVNNQMQGLGNEMGLLKGSRPDVSHDSMSEGIRRSAEASFGGDLARMRQANTLQSFGDQQRRLELTHGIFKSWAGQQVDLLNQAAQAEMQSAQTRGQIISGLMGFAGKLGGMIINNQSSGPSNAGALAAPSGSNSTNARGFDLASQMSTESPWGG